MVDVTKLEIGQAIHIGDIKPPSGVEILGDKHISVLAVAAPVTEAQEAASLEASAGPAGEVEMIKEKKEDGEWKVQQAPAAKGEKAAPAAKAGEKAAPAAADKGEKKPEKKK